METHFKNYMEKSLKWSVVLATILISFADLSQENSGESSKVSLEQLLMGNEWKIDRILGLDPAVETYTLTVYDQTKTVKFAGNLAYFLKDGVFASEYTAWCGNDSFTDLYGDYRFQGTNQIALSVKKVTFKGAHEKPAEEREPKWLRFAISRSGDTVFLTKLKE